jgi:hypothetical protein
MPVASAFLVEKYVGNILTPGTNRHPAPSPIQNACASMKCQYWLEMEVIIMPKTTRNDPTVVRWRK